MSLFRKFSSKEILYIAVLSALGLAVKPIITPLIHLVSAPLLIPGGSLAGGFYMMWLAITIVIINKPGAGFLYGLVQAMVMLSLGYIGNHGAVSLISYTMPGIIAEIIAYFLKNKTSVYSFAVICMGANLSGAVIVTILVMRLPLIPFFISVVAASISGIIGGMLAHSFYRKLKKYKLI